MCICIGIIFYRRGAKTETTQWDFEQKINMSVFPGLQGGPHNHAIAGIAVAMKAAKTEEFHRYQARVVENARRVAAALQQLGYTVVTGGTDCHIVHIDLKRSPGGLSGAKVGPLPVIELKTFIRLTDSLAMHSSCLSMVL